MERFTKAEEDEKVRRQIVKARKDRVCMGLRKPGKSWNLRILFSRPGNSWNLIVSP